MKSILIHVGTEKTGTTSLQMFFSLNKKRLSAGGVWYPDSERLDYCHRRAHFPLAAALFRTRCPDFVTPKKHFDANTLYKRLLSDFEARPEPLMLLSAEHFSSRCSTPERVARMRRLLKGYPVSILLYVRPQHELLLSAYSTFLKSGGKKTLEEVSRERWLKLDAIYFNYLRMAERWCKSFGDHHVRVRVFQEQAMPHGDLYRDLLSSFDAPWSNKLRIPERQNPPISKELADFLYLANQHFPSFEEKDRAGWELGQRFRTEVVDLFPRGKPLKLLLNDSLKEETRAFFAADNAKLARRLRPDLDGKLFFDDLDDPVSTTDTENSFSESFVSWVIEQWKSGQAPMRVLLKAQA